MLAGYSYVRMGRHFVRRTEMEVTIKLREATTDGILPAYEWQVVKLTSYDGDWILHSCDTMAGAIVWMEDNCSETYDYRLQRVPVSKRGKLTPYAKHLMTTIVGRTVGRSKIERIKVVRDITGLSLNEAKELVEDYFSL
jgi:hypothetical protein